MTAHDPAKNIIRTPEEIGTITGTMSAILNGHIGYDCRPSQWKIERSECGTTITFTDIAAQRALTGKAVIDANLDAPAQPAKAVPHFDFTGFSGDLDRVYAAAVGAKSEIESTKASVQPEQPGRIITADEVQPGDKVEITFSLAIVDGEGGNLASGEVNQDRLGKLANLGGASTIRLIERPLKPIAVGDRVISTSAISNGDTATVLHVANGYAMVKFDGAFDPGLLKVDSLARAPVSPSA